MTRIIGVALCWVLLSATAGLSFSREALEQVDRSVTFIELQQHPDTFVGKDLLLGGTIISLESRRTGGMLLEVAQLPLHASNQPDRSFTSAGRFLVTVPDDLDRQEYRPGLAITVVGTVKAAAKTALDGEESLTPVVAVKEMLLWPPPLIERRVPPRDLVIYEQEPETVYSYVYREPYFTWPYFAAPWFPWWFGASFTFHDGPSHTYRSHRDGHLPGRTDGGRSGGGVPPRSPRRAR
jgi:outer membrane lipoprotein